MRYSIIFCIFCSEDKAPASWCKSCSQWIATTDCRRLLAVLEMQCLILLMKIVSSFINHFWAVCTSSVGLCISITFCLFSGIKEQSFLATSALTRVVLWRQTSQKREWPKEQHWTWCWYVIYCQGELKASRISSQLTRRCLWALTQMVCFDSDSSSLVMSYSYLGSHTHTLGSFFKDSCLHTRVVGRPAHQK